METCSLCGRNKVSSYFHWEKATCNCEEGKNKMKTTLLNNYGVRKTEDIDFKEEVSLRLRYLKDFLKKTKLRGFVLGISGGVDSLTAGRLCQLACEELRETENLDVLFYAMRLPYGVQADEEDAVKAIQAIDPDKTIAVDIKVAVDSIHNQLVRLNSDIKAQDFAKGNVKARVRMTTQYELAGLTNCAVVGTDHNSELVPSFYTKWGDQACDLTVLNGLNKRQVRGLAATLGLPSNLIQKQPTADLEDLKPGLPDETALGFSYKDLDDFLEGKKIDPAVEEKILQQHAKTEHKRNWPVGYK